MKDDPQTLEQSGNFDELTASQRSADVLSAFGVHLLTLPVEKAIGYVRRHPGTLAYVGGILIAGGAPLASQAATLLFA